MIKTFLFFVYFYRRHFVPQHRRRISPSNRVPYRMIARLGRQIEHMHELMNMSDKDCIDQLRMDRNAFHRLCFLLENVGGLNRTRHVQITEQVAIFLSILAHHKKTRVVKFDFKRSSYTISTHFNLVLQALLRLHSLLLVTPQPVSDESTDDRWKWFKGCLGALDGTYIEVRVPLLVLSGWEGSAADCRVLRDAVTRRNGLKVPNG
ncbi:hypothetical protein DH2020_014907 [Rehmannia glutinosa]|uniref:DUF8040 domain-containing protein n=1 Tax=Rehmannia glutinosa TaxID=99300 RepID=A0ABR0WXV3_REHGL